VYAIAFALAAKVRSAHATSSPAPIPRTTNARWSAAVPLESASALNASATAESSRSNASFCGPRVVIQFDAIASATSSDSRPERWGGER